jgi:hypothetical protein
MTKMSFQVIRGSPLVNTSVEESEIKYGVKILTYKPSRNSEPFTAFKSKIIKEGYVLEAEGEIIYDIFRDATGYYEIDA